MLKKAYLFLIVLAFFLLFLLLATCSLDANGGGGGSNNQFIWTERTVLGIYQSPSKWYSITSSSDGMKLAACVYGGYIYTSTDGGATWTERTSAGNRYWSSITSSSDGTRLVACAYYERNIWTGIKN